MLESMSFNSHSRKPEADQIREKYALVQEAFPVTARSPSLPLPPSLPSSDSRKAAGVARARQSPLSESQVRGRGEGDP